MGLCASTNSRSNSPNPRSKVIFNDELQPSQPNKIPNDSSEVKLTEDAIEDAAKEAKKVSTPVKQMERGLEQQNGSSKDGIGTHLALLRGTGAPPETQSFHDHGLSLLTHKHEYVLHSNDRSAPDYMLTVWDWKNERIILRTKAFSQEVYNVRFSQLS